MIALLLLQAMPALPQDWTALPLFPLPRAAAGTEATAFVRAEVEAGHCRPAGQDEDRMVAAPMAILVGRSGAVVRIVPRAIDCPTVEQYTVGYLLSLTRGDPGSVLPPQPGWYRLTVTYAW